MAYPIRQGVGIFDEAEAGELVSPAWPTHQAGDIGLLIIEHNNWYTPVDMQGFVEVPWSPLKDGVGGNLASTILSVWWKRAESSAEPAPSFNAPVQAGRHARAVIVTVRGCGSAGPPWDVGNGDVANADTTTVTFEDITTTEAEALVMHIVSNSIDNLTASTSGWANVNLTNVSEWVDSQSAIGDGSGLAIATGQKATAGATGATAAALSQVSRQGRMVIAFTEQNHADKSPKRGLVGAEQVSSSIDITPVWPAHVAGDIGILVAEGGAVPTLADAQGFAEVTPAVSIGAGADATGLGVWWKRAESAAEPNPTVNIGSDHIRALIFTIKGAEPNGNPINVAASGTAASATAVAMPALSPATLDTLVVAVLGTSLDVASDVEVNDWAQANLEGIAEIFDLNVPNVGGSGIAIALGRKKTTGSVGTITATLATASPQSKIIFAVEGITGVLFSADVGAFALAGQAAEAKRSLRLPADTGAFAFAGQDVTFPVHFHFKFFAETGLFIVSPEDASSSKRLINWSKEPKIAGSWFKEAPPSQG